MTTASISCTNCRRPYPPRGLPYQCPKCGGLYDFTELPELNLACIERSLPGIWRYRSMFGLPEKAGIVTLGEGNTPLIPAKVGEREIYFKCEYQNPTGSFKDRGSTLIAAWPVTDSALLFLLDVYASNILGASFSERFVIFYDWLQKVSHDLETQLNEKHFPVILQSFNWIGVYYNSQYYNHKSSLNAFLHWMQIAAGPPWNMSIDGLRMDGFDMYQFDFYH